MKSLAFSGLFFLLVTGSAAAAAPSDFSACSKAYQERKFDDAIALCNRALNARGVDDSDRAFVLRMRGAIYRQMRKLDDAIADFSEVIRLKPRFAQGYLDRALALIDKRETDLASMDLDAAVRVEPDNFDARLNRGYLRSTQGQNDLALADYDAAIRLRPRNAQGYLRRARVHFDQKQFDEAFQDYSQAIKIIPSVSTWMTRGRAYARLGQADNANKDYDEALKIDLKSASELNNRCYELAAAGRAQDALADCNKALALETSARILDSRGYAYLRLQNFPAAITDYDAALRMDPKMTVSLYGRGVAKLKSGNAEQGKADIADAVKLDGAIAEKMAELGVAP